MVCYYREMFGLGVLIALFVFAMVLIFGDVIVEGLRKFIKFVRVK